MFRSLFWNRRGVRFRLWRALVELPFGKGDAQQSTCACPMLRRSLPPYRQSFRIAWHFPSRLLHLRLATTGEGWTSFELRLCDALCGVAQVLAERGHTVLHRGIHYLGLHNILQWSPLDLQMALVSIVRTKGSPMGTSIFTGTVRLPCSRESYCLWLCLTIGSLAACLVS